MQLTVLASWPKLIIQVLQQQGLQTDLLIAQAGIDVNLLSDTNARVPTQAVRKLWQLAMAQTQEDLPLLVAKNVNAGTFHALGFAMATSETGILALQRLVQYYPIITTSINLELVHSASLIGVKISPSQLQTHLQEQFPVDNNLIGLAQMREAGALSLVSLCRAYFGVHFSPELVKLERQLGPTKSLYERFLKCNVEDDSDENVIWFDRSLAEKTLPSANKHLAEINQQIIQTYLVAMRNDWSTSVASEIIKQLPTGLVSQQSVADALNMTPRSLQRKLKHQNQTFRTLLAETRKELAVQYMCHLDIPVLEIGYRLGFSEPANFSRAFKQWTGSSPQIYRQSL